MLTPTRITYLIYLAVLTTGIGFIVASIWPRIFSQAFATPWLTAITMWLLATALFVWTLLARKKIKPEKGKPRLDPILAARSAALAMSASRVGALAMGFYLGIFIDNLFFSDSTASNERALICGLTAIASLATIAVGLWLEHICRITQPPADSNSSTVPTAS
jgi:hypothetical protein